jgi:hypothetical protein
VPGLTVREAPDAIAVAIAELRKDPRLRVAYFPLTQQLADEEVTPAEVAAAVREAIATGLGVHWFDGRAVQTRPPSGSRRPDPAWVRVLLPPDGDPARAVTRGLALGQGLVSLVDPSSGVVTDFATRAFDLAARRVGVLRLTPEVFDRSIPGMACRLCDGTGRVDGVAPGLILGADRFGIEDDRFFTAEAAAALRGARRGFMLPALTRLRDAGLVDLLRPRRDMTEGDVAALWWGYPDKLFLKSGGDPDRPRDWHRWRGLTDYVIDALPSADPVWAGRVRESRHRARCPRCEGTGLGWEASVREVQGVSLRTVRRDHTLADLERWATRLAAQTVAGREALAALDEPFRLVRDLGLGHLRCGEPVATADDRDRLLARVGCARLNALTAATVMVHAPAELRPVAAGAVAGGTAAGDMVWELCGEGGDE